MSKPFDNKPVRFLDKSVNNNERSNYDSWWEEQINMYGTEVTYYQTKAREDMTQDLYGEDVTQGFLEPIKFVLALNLNENAIVMEKFGLVADDEVTAFIHISKFYSVAGESIEPVAGDVFSLSEFGLDRPGDRGGKHFEITEKIDQDVQQINPLIGHYVWLIRAKRHDFSFENNLPREKQNTQVQDDVTEDSKSIFDYTINGNNDDVYGGYV